MVAALISRRYRRLIFWACRLLVVCVALRLCSDFVFRHSTVEVERREDVLKYVNPLIGTQGDG